MGRRSEHQSVMPCGWGGKGRYGSCVGGRSEVRLKWSCSTFTFSRVEFWQVNLQLRWVQMKRRVWAPPPLESCFYHWAQYKPLVGVSQICNLIVVCVFNSWYGSFILVCHPPYRSTQSGHPFVCRRNEYQSVMLCVWRVKAGMVCVWVAGKTCDPLIAHGPYLSTWEIRAYTEALYNNNMW